LSKKETDAIKASPAPVPAPVPAPGPAPAPAPAPAAAPAAAPKPASNSQPALGKKTGSESGGRILPKEELNPAVLEFLKVRTNYLSAYFFLVESEYLLVRALILSFLINLLCISNHRKCEKFKLVLKGDSPRIEMDSRNIIMIPSFLGINRFSYQIFKTIIDDHDNSNSTYQYKAVLLYFSIQSLSYKFSVVNFCISELVRNYILDFFLLLLSFVHEKNDQMEFPTIKEIIYSKF
jgi:hypothetical protein